MLTKCYVATLKALFSLTSLFALSLDPEVHCMDRFALLVTLLLTASTYQITLADELPALGYLTFIDKYVLVTFLFIFVVILEVALTEFVVDANDREIDFSTEDAPGTLNSEVRMNVYKWMFFVDLFIWFVGHLVMIVVVRCSFVFWWRFLRRYLRSRMVLVRMPAWLEASMCVIQ
jgi:hypothetical protein